VTSLPVRKAKHQTFTHHGTRNSVAAIPGTAADEQLQSRPLRAGGGFLPATRRTKSDLIILSSAAAKPLQAKTRTSISPEILFIFLARIVSWSGHR
jgi:hypothetical protein